MTIKQMLLRPKDKDHMDCQSNVIYSYQCKEVDWWIPLGGRYREQLKEPSPIYAPIIHTGHNANETTLTSQAGMTGA